DNLSVRLAGLGRREPALAAIEEAVTTRRRLATRWPDVYQQDLHESLEYLAELTSDRPPEAANPTR
ncbi:hypothetical protein, partial [Virgisporangium aliadipatigenens]|uniref:hypothetical protein n=1 Tax=Virgisporangium aliadipatigenens TaxID=741659 RepID=UPI0019403AF1